MSMASPSGARDARILRRGLLREVHAGCRGAPRIGSQSRHGGRGIENDGDVIAGDGAAARAGPREGEGEGDDRRGLEQKRDLREEATKGSFRGKFVLGSSPEPDRRNRDRAAARFQDVETRRARPKRRAEGDRAGGAGRSQGSSYFQRAVDGACHETPHRCLPRLVRGKADVERLRRASRPRATLRRGARGVPA